jgi:hypothetical protein
LKKRYEVCDIQKVDVNSINNEDSRSFGGEWMSKQMIDAEIIARMIHPSSELETSRWLGGESSLCEMLGMAKKNQSQPTAYPQHHVVPNNRYHANETRKQR